MRLWRVHAPHISSPTQTSQESLQNGCIEFPEVKKNQPNQLSELDGIQSA
jgi:hypothetical protein